MCVSPTNTKRGDACHACCWSFRLFFLFFFFFFFLSTHNPFFYCFVNMKSCPFKINFFVQLFVVAGRHKCLVMQTQDSLNKASDTSSTISMSNVTFDRTQRTW